MTNTSAFADITKELITTERNYVKKLRILKTDYADPLRNFEVQLLRIWRHHCSILVAAICHACRMSFRRFESQSQCSQVQESAQDEVSRRSETVHRRFGVLHSSTCFSVDPSRFDFDSRGLVFLVCSTRSWA